MPAEKRPSRAAVSHVEVRLSAVLFAEVLDLVKAAVVPERHAAVIEQVSVAAAVHSALFVQKRDVAPENRAVKEGISQSVDDLAFAFCQLIWTVGVYGREKAVVELICNSLAFDRAAVYFSEQEPVVHAVLGVTENRLTLEFELNDRDRLESRVHRFAAVGLTSEQCQRAKADAVAALEGAKIPVFYAVAHDVCDTSLAARRRAHPENIVVAPLDVEGMSAHEQIDNLFGGVAPVEDIADNMQPVYREALYQLRERNNEVLCSELGDGIKDLLVVAHLIVVLVALGVEKLVENVGVVLGHRLAHL